MNVWLNGERHELRPGACVADAVDALDAPRTGVAVAVDGAVVPRASWADHRLAEGARLEVLTAVQGG